MGWELLEAVGGALVEVRGEADVEGSDIGCGVVFVGGEFDIVGTADVDGLRDDGISVGVLVP